MIAPTIDHQTLARLVEAGAVRDTQIIGKLGGWSVSVRYGTTLSSLAATRSKEVRVFKRLETLVGYLKEVGISRFEVDAADFDAATVKTYSRPDSSAILKQAHAALVHDRWFREQVAQSVKEADDATTQWVSNETTMAQSAERRAAWRAQSASAKAPEGGG